MRLVVALTGAVEDALLAPLLAARHEIVARPAGAAELASVIASTRPEAVLVQATRSLLGTRVVEAADEVGSRVVVFASTAVEQGLASSLGLHEVLGDDATWPEVAALLAGQGLVPVPPEHARRRGRVIAVWGPAGAPGRTTTAIGIACELAADGTRVALVDADPYGGTVAPLLGLLDEAPGLAAACRLAGSGGLDLAQLDRIGIPVRCPGGEVLVLTGLSRPSRWPELGAERVRTVLDALRDRVDVVVVDTGFSIETDEEIMSDVLAPRRNAATLASLAEADRVVLVGSGDAVSLARLIRAHSELLDREPHSRPDVVVNRIRRGSIGLDARGQVAASLERFAGIRAAAMIPSDPTAFDTAMAAAKPVCVSAPRSPARAALAAYVAEHLAARDEGADKVLVSPQTDSPRRRRILSFR